MTDGPRFEFGKNWQKFVDSIDDEKLLDAQKALVDLLGTESLANQSFLDAGCGSGIVSLAAHNLGAIRTHSFDYDPNSVMATQALMNARSSGDAWLAEQGSITDPEYLKDLGQFDTVYSWGVIHHTGAMWQAADNLPALLKPGGRLVVAIYNDQGLLSTFWGAVKKLYVTLPSPAQFVMSGLYFVLTSAVQILKNVIKRRSIRRNRPRGMSAWHDAIDWVGGYPFEVASREQVVEFYEARGFTTEKVISVGNRQGCNQFVFRSPANT